MCLALVDDFESFVHIYLIYRYEHERFGFNIILDVVLVGNSLLFKRGDAS